MVAHGVAGGGRGADFNTGRQTSFQEVLITLFVFSPI